MTTKQEERTAGLGRLQVYSQWPHDIFASAGNIASAITPGVAAYIVEACNNYEKMKEALVLAEKADRIHSRCEECENGTQAPEVCPDCFPSADDARVARRNVLTALGVLMRDVDRAALSQAMKTSEE